ISDRLPVEQQLWLEANGVRFFARWLPDLTGAPRGGVLILHDAGQHPSWPLTVAALFDSLPLHGWHTLAMELPTPGAVPEVEVDSPATPTADAGAGLSPLEQRVQGRIDAALAHLGATEGGTAFVALVAFGQSAPRAAEALRRLEQMRPLQALVLVDAANAIPGLPRTLPQLLPLSAAPVEDLLQSEDRLALAAQTERRHATL